MEVVMATLKVVERVMMMEAAMVQAMVEEMVRRMEAAMVRAMAEEMVRRTEVVMASPSGRTHAGPAVLEVAVAGRNLSSQSGRRARDAGYPLGSWRPP